MATLKMIIPVIFFLIAATIACGADSTETPPVSPTPPLPWSSVLYLQKFENPLYGYSIDIPAGWLPSEVTAPAQKIAFASPDLSVLGSVRVANLTAPSLNDMMDEWLELTETRPHKSFQVLNRTDATDMGEYDQTSVMYYLDREDDNCPREHIDYLRTGLSRTYFLSLRVCIDDAEQYTDTLDYIYFSFDTR